RFRQDRIYSSTNCSRCFRTPESHSFSDGVGTANGRATERVLDVERGRRHPMRNISARLYKMLSAYWDGEKVLPNRKIRIADNRMLSDAEYDLCCRLCDIILAVSKSSSTETAPTGKWWPHVGENNSHRQFLGKNRHFIDHSLLLRTRFRDFPT